MESLFESADFDGDGEFVSIERLENITRTELEEAIDEIIATFQVSSKGDNTLQEGAYKVIAASSESEVSAEYDGNPPYGLFTKILVDASGYRGEVLSDANEDGELTIDETYEYVYRQVVDENDLQHVQVYPENSEKVWTIDFNSNVSNDSIVNGIYISETRAGDKLYGVNLEIRGSSVLLNPPSDGWDYDRYYYIHVNDNVKSDVGKSLKESKIVRFKVEK